MPFTPSHAVVALPFIRTALVPAAVAIGAMTPDLPLFERFIVPSYAVTHDLAALPLTILMALLLLLVWRCVLRPAARQLLPDWVAGRLPASWDAGLRANVRETFPSSVGALVLLASLAIGVATHIVWDLFTHEGRWGSDVLPILDQNWGPLTGYKWLQHGSSAFGLIVIAVWAVMWLRGRDAVSSVPRVLPAWARWMWWASLPIALIGAWGYGLAVYGALDANWTAAHLAYRVLPPACAVWAVASIALCVLVQWLQRRHARAASPICPVR